MRLKEGFITHQMGQEQVMVAVGGNKFSGMVKSNPTAAFIVDCLKKDVSEEDIVAAMLEKYDAAESVIKKDVAKIVETLRGIGAIEE